MSTFKTLLVLALLGGVGYCTYITLNPGPAPEPPPDAPKEWEGVPMVDMGMPSMPNEVSAADASASLSSAPPFSSGGSTSGAPSFESSAPSFSASAPGAAPSFSGATESAAPSYPDSAQGSAPPFTSDAGASAPPFAGSANSSPASSNVPPDVSDAASALLGPPVSNPGDQTTNTNDSGAATPSAAGSAPGWGQSMASASDESSSAPGASPAAFLEAKQRAEQALAAGKLAEAHLELSAWYGNPQLSPTDEAKLVQLLDQLAGSVVYSREHLLEAEYEVQPGERLQDIARRYNVPAELLAKINGIEDPERLYPGEQLKVIRGPFRAIISLERQELTLMIEDAAAGTLRYAGRFPIEVAGGVASAEGGYFVQQKSATPRWIDLGQGLSLHGSQSPQQQGVRLADRDLSDVYDMLQQGSKIFIRR